MKISAFFRSEDSNNGDRPWKPSYRWMGIAAGMILLFLIIVFFALNIFLKPYMRTIPLSVTPWLDKSKNEVITERRAVQTGQGGQDAKNQGSAD